MAVKCIKDLQLFVVVTLVIYQVESDTQRSSWKGHSPSRRNISNTKSKEPFWPNFFYQFQYQRNLVDQILGSVTREVPDEKDEKDDVGEGGGEVDHLAAGLDSLLSKSCWSLIEEWRYSSGVRWYIKESEKGGKRVRSFNVLYSGGQWCFFFTANSVFNL